MCVCIYSEIRCPIMDLPEGVLQTNDAFMYEDILYLKCEERGEDQGILRFENGQTVTNSMCESPGRWNPLPTKCSCKSRNN